MTRCDARSPDRRRFSFVCVAIGIFCILMSCHAFANDNVRRVVLLAPNDSTLTVTNQLEAGILRELQSELPTNLEIYSEYLDINRFPETEHLARLAAYLRDKYARRPIDLVIAIFPDGLDFVMRRRQFLFPQSQVMFTRVTEDELRNWHVPPEISGIVTRYDPARTVDLALHLQPDATRLIIVTGNSNIDRHTEAVTPERLKAFAHRLKVSYWSGMPLDDLMSAVGKLPQRTFVMDLGVNSDRSGRVFRAEDVDQKLAASASVPVYCPYETVFGLGNVGANMEDFDAEGRQTAQLAVRLMNNHNLTGQHMIAPTSTIVDWRQLQRWGLNEANLPPDTIVRFRNPSLWEEHKWLVIGSVAALFVQSLLIAALIVQARRRQRAQAALDVQQQELTHLGRVATLGALSGAIAHEINNPLMAILSNAQAATRFLDRTPIDTNELRAIHGDIAADSKRAGEVIQRLRALFKKTDKRIEPVNLNRIVADVLELAKRKLFEGNVTVTTKLANGVPEVRADPVQLKQVLLNIVINACDAMEDNNPSDRSLTIATSYDRGMVQVSVSDLGNGISESVKERLFQPFVTTKSSGTGLGLSICRSIIEAHGGRLSASNNPDRGATFSVELPGRSICL